MIGILDYEAGNLGSVTNACRYLDIEAVVLDSAKGVEDCHALILPGVGAFGDCMSKLDAHGFAEAVPAWVAAGKPLLGICVGLQVLYEGSEESPGVSGLGLLPGCIKRFPGGPGLKVPQMGWNTVSQRLSSFPLFSGIENDTYFYFVHSYYAPEPAGHVAGVTEYGVSYASAIWQNNMMATQFHPEKSHRDGLRMLRNFADWSETV